MCFNQLVLYIYCVVKCVEEVRLALTRKRNLERLEELNERAVSVVSVDIHQNVRVVGQLFRSHYS